MRRRRWVLVMTLLFSVLVCCVAHAADEPGDRPQANEEDKQFVFYGFGLLMAAFIIYFTAYGYFIRREKRKVARQWAAEGQRLGLTHLANVRYPAAAEFLYQAGWLRDRKGKGTVDNLLAGSFSGHPVCVVHHFVESQGSKSPDHNYYHFIVEHAGQWPRFELREFQPQVVKALGRFVKSLVGTDSGEALEKVTLDTAQEGDSFSEQYEVYAEDERFARAVFTPELRADIQELPALKLLADGNHLAIRFVNLKEPIRQIEPMLHQVINMREQIQAALG